MDRAAAGRRCPGHRCRQRRPRGTPGSGHDQAASASGRRVDVRGSYFDFDRSTLRPDALRLLDDAVAKLQANPGRSIVIEGHTCNIGTAEYNLALGNRRATSVRDYLQSRGVPANRMETRSYGEERPKYDNAREETRRLNRRAALTVRVQ